MAVFNVLIFNTLRTLLDGNFENVRRDESIFLV